MLRISKLTDYGTVVMVHVAREPQRFHSASEIATAVFVAPPTVAKVLKVLTRNGLLASQLGVRGGYRLARAPETISIAEVLDALEGPLAVTECSEGLGLCAMEGTCAVSGVWQEVNGAIRTTLRSISLADITAATAPVVPEPGVVQLGAIFK
jgi:FeS assembly SUF system regulator